MPTIFEKEQPVLIQLESDTDSLPFYNNCVFY